MNITRRNFLKTGAAAVAGFTIAPNTILGSSHGHMAPSDTPNIAAVGVGSQGGGDIQNIADPDEKIGRRPNPDRQYGGWVSPNFAGLAPERRMVNQAVQMGDAGKQPIHHANMYALCDVDLDYAGHIMAGYPKAKKYQDFRKMLDECGKEIDDPIANYSLGLIKFREKNNNAYTEGMSYMRTAAKRKYGPALTAVGVMALTNNPRKPKIISASADIFRQAYEAGDPTGGILYGLMLIIGAGVEQDSTLGFSIFYDLKNRGYESINPLLSYYTYTTDVDTKLLFKQILRVIYKQYVGDLCFAEGAPEAVDYLDSNRNSTMSFYKKQKDDIHRFSFDLLQKLGKNLVINLDDPEQVTIDGLPLLFPEISKMLEMYNPTTGAKHFMPKMVLSIEASVPRLPKDYDKFELDLDSLADKF